MRATSQLQGEERAPRRARLRSQDVSSQYSTLGLPARRAMGWVAPQQGGGQNARHPCPRPPEQQRHAVCSVYGVVFPSALQQGETGGEDADAWRGPARCQPRKSKRQPKPKQKGQQIGGLQH